MLLNVRKMPVARAFWICEKIYIIELKCDDEIVKKLNLINNQNKIRIEYLKDENTIRYINTNYADEYKEIKELNTKGNNEQVIKYLKDNRIIKNDEV